MFPSSLSCWTVLLLFLPTRSLAQNSLPLSPAPLAKNADVSEPLDPSFAGFGIEPSNLFSFTGGSETNTLSVQLLQNLAEYSGAPPHIRLGGNTQDYMLYDASYNDFACKQNAQSTAQGIIAADSMIIGPGYFKALDRFPKNTPITYGLNLAYQASDYTDRIVTAAKAALEGMSNVKLYSFEIGNEPDLYLQNSFRSGVWNGKIWGDQFLDRANSVYTQVLKPASLPAAFFESPATASTIGTTFEIATLVKNGLINDMNGNKYVATWNQHDYFYFIGVTKTPITLDILMDLDATNTQFAYWEKQVGIGLRAGLPYALREMSSVGPIGKNMVSDTHGAALWTLNFFLYTAALGIASVQMHMTDNSNASAWQPITLYGNDPFVRPQYYAHAAIAQIIGNGNGTTQIGALNTDVNDGDYAGRIRAYAAYANGNLQAVVLINSKQANASQSGKATFTFNINLGKSNGNKDVFLSYLTSDGADLTSGTTWNGMQYSNSSGKSSMVDKTVDSRRTSSSGAVSIPVRDSQAIVVNIGSLLGSNAVLYNGTRPTGKKSTAGPTSTSGASTAAWTGVFTTTLALASSFTGAANGAEETGGGKAKGEARRHNVSWRTLGVCLTLMVGIAYMSRAS